MRKSVTWAWIGRFTAHFWLFIIILIIVFDYQFCNEMWWINLSCFLILQFYLDFPNPSHTYHSSKPWCKIPYFRRLTINFTNKECLWCKTATARASFCTLCGHSRIAPTNTRLLLEQYDLTGLQYMTLSSQISSTTWFTNVKNIWTKKLQ